MHGRRGHHAPFAPATVDSRSTGIGSMVRISVSATQIPLTGLHFPARERGVRYMANKVSRFLAREDVILELDATDKGQALERIARFLEQRYGIKHEPVYRALLRREQIGATGIGHGIAIPHARIAGITQPMLLVAPTRQPIKFGAPAHQPVSTLFVI